MIFASFIHKGIIYPGIVKADKLVPLEVLGINYRTLEETARNITDEQLEVLKEAHDIYGYSLGEITLLPAIPEPYQEVIVMENNFICDGGRLPTYFYKKATFSNCDGARIPSYPGHVTELDYQVEVCAVVKNDAYQVSVENAKKHIFGYLLINNFIARNLTVRHRRPYIATSLDGYLPMGCFIVSPDEFPERLEMNSYVNGELRQHGYLDEAQFDFAYAISNLSRISVLRGGSLISSGTPFGTSRDLNKPYLCSGDVVTVEAGLLGTISNIVD